MLEPVVWSKTTLCGAQQCGKNLGLVFEAMTLISRQNALHMYVERNATLLDASDDIPGQLDHSKPADRVQ